MVPFATKKGDGGMQWILVAVWGGSMLLCVQKGFLNPFRIAMALGLAASMGLQLVLLWQDGLLSIQTALPLHLCGLFGVLSIPMLWRAPAPLWELSAFLAGPAAFITLFFPAVMACSHPQWMAFAFDQLHVLVALTPVFLAITGKPLPRDPRRALLLGSGYLCFIGAFNRAFHTNYLFLRQAPSGTPLALFLSRGTAFYVCSLLMLCMAVFTQLKWLYCRK